MRKPLPVYPKEALVENMQGWVDLELCVNPVGEVVEAVVLNSVPTGFFDEAALSTIERWKFPPTNGGGDSFITLRICYRLVEGEKNK